MTPEPRAISQYYMYEPSRISENSYLPNLKIIEVDDVITREGGTWVYLSTGDVISGVVEFATRGTTHCSEPKPSDKKHPRLICYRALNCDLVCIDTEE